MRNFYLLFFSFFILHTASSQYCTNVGPNSTIDSNVESVVLNGVIGSINYTGCPGVLGLQDLTSLGTTLNAGSSYTAQIKFGTCGGNYPGVGQAWIDFDQNGIFDLAESIGTWQGTPPVATSNFNFTVPPGAQNGTTRMRITHYEGGTLPINPCATFTWGSVMDFSITIGNGIDCSGFIGDDTTDPIVVPSLPYSNTGDNSYCYSNQNTVYNSPDVFYQLSPSPLMQSITVSLCGSTFDTFLSVTDPSGNIIAFNDDAQNCGTQSELTFNPSGFSSIYIIVEGWGSQAGDYSISIDADYLSTDEIDNSQIEIFPNPSNDYFTVNGFSGDLELVNIMGSIIEVYPNYHGEIINISHIPNGIYFIRNTIAGKQFSEKLIKQ